jgi:hypothetical protein
MEFFSSQSPDRFNIIGAVIALAGVVAIIYILHAKKRRGRSHLMEKKK